jgi:hypothetical protein
LLRVGAKETEKVREGRSIGRVWVFCCCFVFVELVLGWLAGWLVVECAQNPKLAMVIFTQCFEYTKSNTVNLPGTVAYTCNPRTLEGETGRSVVLGQPGLQSKTLSPKKKKSMNYI